MQPRSVDADRPYPASSWSYLDIELPSTDADPIASVEAWACSLPLERPLSFGDFEVRAREYVAVRIATNGGLRADCLALSRRAPIDVVLIDVLAPLVVERDALHVTARLSELEAATRPLDQDGIMARARSLLEICLWDLRAQAAQLPLWRMLGGEPRQVPVLLIEGYALSGESDSAFIDRVAGRVAEGFHALKIEAASYDDPHQLHARLAGIRELVGDDVELVVDMAWLWRRVDEGVAAERLWRECGLAWIEDPLPRGRVAEMATLRSSIATPIGAGDEVTRPDDLLALIRAKAVDVLRVDATAIGGLRMTLDLIALASASGLRPSLHEHPEIHEHCVFAWPKCDHVELFPTDRPFDRRHDLLQRTSFGRIEEGALTPPTELGTGLVLDLDAVRRSSYRHGKVETQHSRV